MTSTEREPITRGLAVGHRVQGGKTLECPNEAALLALSGSFGNFAVTANKPKLALCTAVHDLKLQCCGPPSNISGELKGPPVYALDKR